MRLEDEGEKHHPTSYTSGTPTAKESTMRRLIAAVTMSGLMLAAGVAAGRTPATMSALTPRLQPPTTTTPLGAVGSDCTFKGKKMYGKVQKVTSFPDIKVQKVTSFPDLKVQKVTSFPDSCGKWQFVTSFPDFKVQFVTSFPDIKVQFVTSFPGI
jgi:hypothetical protein